MLVHCRLFEGRSHVLTRKMFVELFVGIAVKLVVINALETSKLHT